MKHVILKNEILKDENLKDVFLKDVKDKNLKTNFLKDEIFKHVIFKHILFSVIFILSINTLTAQLTETTIKDKYSEIAKLIVAEANKDSLAYEQMGYFCDAFGPRLSGSENLENALEWAYQQMKRDGLENVLKEEVLVPKWVRGNEYCTMNSPWKHKMAMLGLGMSIGTPKEGITAPIIVVDNFDDLAAKSEQIPGKIVVYNDPYENYGQAVQYRVWGASRAAYFGAVAVLVRSVTPLGHSIPHTGSMRYIDTLPKIPAAAISIEDALLMDRLQKMGKEITATLYMEAETHDDVISYNVMGELPGSQYPEQIIAIGGHSDSWDAGTGAHDDASGCFATWKAVKLIKDLGLKPKRTIRAVMWVNEENGVRGGHTYAEKHKGENHVLMMEFDSGLFPPEEFLIRSSDSVFNIIKAFEPVLKIVDSRMEVKRGGWGVDIDPLVKMNNIPAMNLNTADEGTYFWYHHSSIDTMDKINPKDLNQCIAAIALAIYIYADL